MVNITNSESVLHDTHAATAQCARMNTNGSIFFCPFVPCHLIVPRSNALVSCHHISQQSGAFASAASAAKFVSTCSVCTFNKIMFFSSRPNQLPATECQVIYQFHTGSDSIRPPPLNQRFIASGQPLFNSCSDKCHSLPIA